MFDYFELFQTFIVRNCSSLLPHLETVDETHPTSTEEEKQIELNIEPGLHIKDTSSVGFNDVYIYSKKRQKFFLWLIYW